MQGHGRATLALNCSPGTNGDNQSYASNLDNTNRGRTLYNPNQFGFNGAFFFARLNYTLQ